MSRPSLSTSVLLALGAGLFFGLLLSHAGAATTERVVVFLEPFGALFVNAIRMTVIPLVTSLVIVGIGTADRSRIARIGTRALLVALAFLGLSGLAGAIVAPLAFSRITIDPSAVAALRARATLALNSPNAFDTTKRPELSQWIIDLVPANPIRAAADGAMLPLIVFAVTFGLALLSVVPEHRDPVVRFFRGVADAMLRLVRWVLVLAPLGVFALTLPLVARLGLGAIGALASYVALIALTTTTFVLLVIYPAAAILGHVSMARFARAVFPAQAVAFSSRTSLAALPALIEGAQRRLGMTTESSGFLLPLASALFRVGAAMGLTVGAVFVARLYGADLTSAQVLTAAATAILTSFSIPGIPGGSIIAMVPVLASVGLPIDGIGILLGVDTIPDAFRTTANVTGQMAAAVIAERPRD
ncbi:MAG: dicarboxylate/amino acid:cation symporter [Gemmatimonadaceae bacterium]